jgi:hypothetical protein
VGLENGPLPGEEDIPPPLNPGLDGGAALDKKCVYMSV